MTSEDQDKESKTELPTEKKRNDALEKGNVPISREVPHAAFFATLLLVIALCARPLSDVSQVLKTFLERPGDFRLENASDVGLLGWALVSAMTPWLTVGAAVFLFTGLAASVVQTPPRIAYDRILPKASRLSIKSGWKRIFGLHGLAELLKGLVKIAVVLVTGTLFVASDSTALLTSLDAPLTSLPGMTAEAVREVMWKVVLVAVLLALADIVWTRFRWVADLKMTKQEVRDEHKQQEGDPALVARRRALARSRSRKRMISNVPSATLVIANPTHFAVAMRYVRSEGGAPRVVAKGADLLALQIRRTAEEHGIPVVEDKPLARALYDAVEVDQTIPPAFYRTVAEILIVLQRRGNPKTATSLRTSP